MSGRKTPHGRYHGKRFVPPGCWGTVKCKACGRLAWTDAEGKVIPHADRDPLEDPAREWAVCTGEGLL